MFYVLIRSYIRAILFFYFKKTKVVGLQNIPKNEAVLFVANHENALLDSIMLATTNNSKAYFLSRASVFSNPFNRRFFNSLRMIPIYRIRDGWQSLNKNTEVFNTCFKLLNDKKTIAIFPEGDHHLNRRVRQLSKGFTRIIFGALDTYKDLKIYIVPVGINYDAHITYPQSISLYYGKAFLANPFYDASDVHLSTRQMVAKTSDELKKLTVHIEDLKTYDGKIKQLKALNANFLNPLETNELLHNLPKETVLREDKKPVNFWYKLVFAITALSAWLPYLIWKILKQKIKDPIFFGTFRFALHVILIPLFCLLQTFIVYSFFGLNVGLYFLTVCVSLAFLLKWVPYKNQ